MDFFPSHGVVKIDLYSLVLLCVPVSHYLFMGYFSTDNELIDCYGSVLGAYGVAVYSIIKRHENNGKGGCFPSVEMMAHKGGMSKRQVSRAVKVLERYGIVRVGRRRGHGNWYSLTSRDKWVEVGPSWRASGGKVDGGQFFGSDGWHDLPNERALTCDSGHSWDVDGVGGRVCLHCGLLRAEEYYKQMVPAEERGGYRPGEIERDLPF